MMQSYSDQVNGLQKQVASLQSELKDIKDKLDSQSNGTSFTN